MKRRVARMVALGLLVASSCGNGQDDATAPSPSDATTTPSDNATSPALVGTWTRETHCDELVSALMEAELDQWVLEFVAGNGFLPGVRNPDQIEDPTKPCEGAVPREHSHFFTEDGEFGSLDWNGEAVDDGTYEIVDDDTFVVSKEFPDVTFNFAIDGDAITFDPEIPACAPDCFEAAWSVTVAYPGEQWQLVGGAP